MAIEDHVAMENSDNEQGLQALKEDLEFIAYNGTWTGAALPPGKSRIPGKMLFEPKFDD